MGLYGQRLVQDKNLNPPDDHKYLMFVSLREEKGVAIPRAEGETKHAVHA
jgi:hypothetical protein